MNQTLLYVIHCFQYAGAALMLYWLVATKVRAIRGRPHFSKDEVVFQEWRASGCSQRYWWTKIGGGRNCVRLVVTRRILWVTSWFPFSLITPFYDMEHVIPLESITSVRDSRKWFGNSLLLSYTDAAGNSHELRLMPRNREAFVGSIGGWREAPGA